MLLQEKTEAEMKQLRKALNFKAAPMPSFYNVATASRPDANKVNKFIGSLHFKEIITEYKTKFELEHI